METPTTSITITDNRRERLPQTAVVGPAYLAAGANDAFYDPGNP